MGEQAYHGAQVCSSANPRKCQDLGDSILLILGSFILLNVGINVVTLLWRHLKSSLRIIFHHFFPKDKQHNCLGGHPMCMRCSPNPKNLCSRASSRFYRHPSFPLGRSSHLDSWMPDMSDEKAFKCCWKPSQCGHGGAPTEIPWELSKEGMVGAGEAPQAQNLKTQTNFLSKQDVSSQPTRMNKLDMVPLHLPQEIKTKTPDSAPAQAISASIPVPTPGPTLAPNPVTFNHGLSTGHVVYDARRVKQNLLQVCPPQHSGFPRKDLGALIMSQEGPGLLSSDTPGQASKPSDEDSAKTSMGSILGYLELGNMEWKLSKDAEDKFSQSKSFPYCSFHPCSSEGKTTDPQASVCPKFLVYSKDAAPSQPCFHSPTNTWNSQCMPPPCTLSLPLAPPRSFVFDHPSNHLKPTLNTSAILIASKSPRSSPAPQCPNPPPHSIPTSFQPQPPKLHENINFTQDSGHHKTPDPSKESIVLRKPGLSQNLGFHNSASLCKGLVPSQDSELHKNPIINEDVGPPKNSGLTKETDNFRNPSLTQPSDLHENIPFPKKSDSQKSPGFTRDSNVYGNPEQNQKTMVYKNQDVSPKSCLHNHSGPSQDSTSCGSTGNSQMPVISRSEDSGPQKCVSQDSRVIKSSDLSQESGVQKNPDFAQTSHLHKESGDYKNPCLTQDSDPHKNLSLATEAKQRFVFAHGVGICRNPENSQDSNFQKYPGVHQNCDPSKKHVFIQDSGQLKHIGVSQESTPNHDHKPNDLARGIGSVQVLGPLQAPKSTESPMKSFVSKECPQENAEPHVSWISIPPNHNSCSSKCQVVHNDLQTFSEVPVLVELQPSTKQTGSQDWVYHPVNIAPSVCQNYRQMSVPPKSNWKPYYPGPGTRLGHVVFDARQRQFGVGRDKCEALFPRRFRPDIASNSAEWEYQYVMRNFDKEGTKMHQE
ncbi:uncharacterized protein SPEM3 [Sorex fumeus]|uniref:uncharacterized protein SPEM3 n=1 Tax=Sorex fumeus TaxID=62283 RepID=UPI0024AD0308|nr:uncharacterized protein SPEM3 [Sorex fumeus]